MIMMNVLTSLDQGKGFVIHTRCLLCTSNQLGQLFLEKHQTQTLLTDTNKEDLKRQLLILISITH